ncbi:hypothetical protein Taro_008218, partial [Colocasia esculenta]|nr:hypothetical protein [Colocasia esculenta]
GVPYPSLQKKEKPRRVELYFSSWRIRAEQKIVEQSFGACECLNTVESRKQDGQLSACEVTLIHYEDMGIPKDVAKIGVRHGMWGAVKRLQSGMRAYQLARKSDSSLSRSALMARNTTKITLDGVICSLENEQSEEHDIQNAHKTGHGFDWRWVVIGGTIAVVCGMKTGIIGRTILYGAARRLARK